jgi:hypothetical protein
MMTNEKVNDGQVSPPLSQKSDKYAEYFELNPETDEDVGTSEPEVKKAIEKAPADDKQIPQKEQSQAEESSTEEKQAHVPGWQKRINKQTAKIKMLEEQLAAIQEKKATQKEMPKYTRENFVSEQEYEDWKDKVTDERVNRKFTEQQEQQLIQLKQQHEEEDFNNGWQERVAHNFDGDAEGYKEFAGLVQQKKSELSKWHQDIHDYMEGTEYGPRMMQVMFYRSDIVDNINRAKPVVRTKLLMNLESEIVNVMNGLASKPAVAPTVQPKVSKAPGPIGTVGTSNQVLSEDEADDVAYEKYVNKKIRGSNSR